MTATSNGDSIQIKTLPGYFIKVTHSGKTVARANKMQDGTWNIIGLGGFGCADVQIGTEGQAVAQMISIAVSLELRGR